MAMNTASVSTVQRGALAVGVVFLGACVIHAAVGGWALADGEVGKGALYAVIMACITIAAAIIPTITGKFRDHGNTAAVVGLSLAWVLCLAGEGVGNLNSMGHTRNKSMTLANVADTQATDRRSSIADTERTIALIEASIKERSKGAGWLSTKPVAAWDADIKNMEGDKIYTRSKQCGNVTLPDSRAFCDKLNEARANLAVASVHEKDMATLATSKATLAEMRSVARDDKPGISAARTQSDNFVRLAGVMNGQWVQAASEEGRSRANFGVELFMVVVMMIGPAALFYAGSYDWDAYRVKRHGAIAKALAWMRGIRLEDDKAPPRPLTMPHTDRNHTAPAAPVLHFNDKRMAAIIARLTQPYQERAA